MVLTSSEVRIFTLISMYWKIKKKIAKIYIYEQGKMFTIFCEVRKGGSEKSINYDSILVKLHLCASAQTIFWKKTLKRQQR